jgi:hypothetical protein
MRSTVLYLARQHCNRPSAALHSIWRWKTTTDYLLRSTLSGESTADSLLRYTLISVYLLRPTIFCTPLHSVCRDDCRISASVYSIWWFYITSDYLLRSDYLLHLTLSGETIADSRLHSSLFGMTTSFLLYSTLGRRQPTIYSAPLHFTPLRSTSLHSIWRYYNRLYSDGQINRQRSGQSSVLLRMSDRATDRVTDNAAVSA